MPKFAFICGDVDSLIRFRSELCESILEKGYKIYVLTAECSIEFIDELNRLGVTHIEINFKRKSTGIFNSLLSCWDVYVKLKALNPEVVYSFTHKSVVIGSLCAWLARVKNINSMITGTGHLFEKDSLKQRIVRFIGILSFRFSLKLNNNVFFQNKDNLSFFLKKRMAKDNQTVLVNGSGVNLEKFNVTSLPENPVFLCMSRLIKSKGLREYASACKIAKEKIPNARFLLAGFSDDHADSISVKEIKEGWFEEYGVEFIGKSYDPIKTISQCNVFTLLSYNEGTPRSVLEAMSMGRSIITTDTSGCRETINGKNGFLVPLYDSLEASKAMIALSDKNLREEMGKQSRIFCEEKFNCHNVNRLIMDSIFNQ